MLLGCLVDLFIRVFVEWLVESLFGWLVDCLVCGYDGWSVGWSCVGGWFVG